jgi:hypothetical protein
VKIATMRVFDNPWRYAVTHPDQRLVDARLDGKILILIDRKFWDTMSKARLRQALRRARRRRNLLFMYNVLDVYDWRGRNIRHVNLARLRS